METAINVFFLMAGVTIAVATLLLWGINALRKALIGEEERTVSAPNVSIGEGVADE